MTGKELCPLHCKCQEAFDEIERLRAALEPFARVARWAEDNGHDLTKGWDMLLRAPDGSFAGHLQVQSPEFIAALRAVQQLAQPKETTNGN